MTLYALSFIEESYYISQLPQGEPSSDRVPSGLTAAWSYWASAIKLSMLLSLLSMLLIANWSHIRMLQPD